MQRKSMEPVRSLLSVRDAAWALGVDRSAVCRAIRRGVLPLVRRRGRTVVPAAAVTRLLCHADTPRRARQGRRRCRSPADGSAARHEGPRRQLVGRDREPVGASAAGAQRRARRDRGPGRRLHADQQPTTGRRAGSTRTAPTASWPLGSARDARSSSNAWNWSCGCSASQTVGVWGALGEDDRRALVPHWRRSTARPCRAPISSSRQNQPNPTRR